MREGIGKKYRGGGEGELMGKRDEREKYKGNTLKNEMGKK
jgi:hypothetical protein